VALATPTVQALVASPKGEQRACFKANEKYHGDYSRLNDLARMTFACSTLRDALSVLRKVRVAEGWTMLRIKNRLMLAFDASETGGYRDMLLNLCCQATGHIIEIQITLAPLLAIKASSGHASYQIARLHGLFERATFRHEGTLSHELLERVRCGIVRELVCRGTATGLAAHFDELLSALSAPSCALSELRLVGCDWPDLRTFDELAAALPSGLKVLGVTTMSACSGALPAALFEKLRDTLELVGLYKIGLTGRLPTSLGACTKLRALRLQDNQLEGPIPEVIGRCAEMLNLDLSNNSLSGHVPPSLGACTKLRTAKLHENAGLAITESAKAVMKKAAPAAQFGWPAVV